MQPDQQLDGASVCGRNACAQAHSGSAVWMRRWGTAVGRDALHGDTETGVGDRGLHEAIAFSFLSSVKTCENATREVSSKQTWTYLQPTPRPLLWPVGPLAM